MSNVTFARPVQSFGEEISAIVLREPTGAEMRRIGLPFCTLPNGAIDPDMDRVAKYAAILATPPLSPPAIDKLSGADFVRLAVAVLPFFGDSTSDPTPS